MKTVDNPFVISGYEGAQYFCDRDAETAQLRHEIANGNNVALIATRRMGKSGLIEHYFSQPEIQARYYTFFIDIYDTKSLREVVRKLSREILVRLKPFGARAMESFWQTMRSIKSGISFSPLGEPTFSVQVGDIKEPEATLDEIFCYLELADRPCIVAIDEFQQIGKFPEKNIEATLRTYVQRCHNAQFIFSGSGNRISCISRSFHMIRSISGQIPCASSCSGGTSGSGSGIFPFFKSIVVIKRIILNIKHRYPFIDGPVPSARPCADGKLKILIFRIKDLKRCSLFQNIID